MDLILLTEERRYIGTETEAKKLKKPYEKRDVPIVKAKMIDYLNAEEEERERALAAAFEEGRQAGLAEASGEPVPEAPVKKTPAAPKPSATNAGERRSLVEQILESEKEQMPQILSAAIGRLGEIAGSHGWAAFGKDVYSWTPGARHVEQGLGMLMLAAFNNFGMNTDQKPKRSKITPTQETEEE